MRDKALKFSSVKGDNSEISNQEEKIYQEKNIRARSATLEIVAALRDLKKLLMLPG